MFKSIEWTGFDDRHDLQRQVEDRLPDIAAEVGSLADLVDVEIAARDDQADGPLLSVKFGLSVAGLSASQHALVDADWLHQPRLLMRVVRGLWGVVLDSFLRQLARRVNRDLLATTAGV